MLSDPIPPCSPALPHCSRASTVVLLVRSDPPTLNNYTVMYSGALRAIIPYGLSSGVFGSEKLLHP